uniref:Uncharacterized protein n=1 Tax=Mola mola TaxID=94237 RepID=A0A3Q4BPC9_MOLML
MYQVGFEVRTFTKLGVRLIGYSKLPVGVNPGEPEDSLTPATGKGHKAQVCSSGCETVNCLFPSQEATQRRVEKAEILENTVLFLQSTAAGNKARVGGGGGGQKDSFQEGFSTCLQRATRFLGPGGKGLWLGQALDTSLAAPFSTSDSHSADLRKGTEAPSSSSLLLRTSSRSLLQLIHRSGHRLCTPALFVVRCVQNCREHQRPPNPPQRPHRVASRESKQSPSQSHQVSQSLWRPWP